MTILRFVLLAACLLFTQPSLAHKLNLFTYVEGEQVIIEGYFADGKKAQNSEVKVYNEHREIITEGTTNDEGEFSFTPAEKTTLRIVLNAGMGHMAEYTLPASEFGLMDASVDQPISTDKQTSTSNTPEAVVGQQELKVIIDQAVSDAVRPLTKEISELKNKTSLSDIVGGIGFILGALGLFAYFKARKNP